MPQREPDLSTLRVARETAPFDETCHAVRDDCHYLRHIVARQPPDWMELNAVPVVREHAVQHQHVQVDVEIERAAEALQDRHGAAAAVGDAVTACTAPEQSEHRPHGHAAHGPTQVVIPREQVPQPMWQAQHPLPNRPGGSRASKPDRRIG